MEGKKIFFPDLDGWRFIAFLAVFYHHSFYTSLEHLTADPVYRFIAATTRGGDLGVDFFLS